MQRKDNTSKIFSTLIIVQQSHQESNSYTIIYNRNGSQVTYKQYYITYFAIVSADRSSEFLTFVSPKKKIFKK